MSIEEEEDSIESLSAEAEADEGLVLALELERELHLENFLEQTDDFKKSTEHALEKIRALPGDSPAGSSEPKSVFEQSLEEFYGSIESRFELTNSFIRDGVDVLDGRIALSTRMLAERHDEHTVGLSQMGSTVLELEQLVLDVQTSIHALKQRPGSQHDSLFHQEMMQRLEELSAQMLSTIDSGTLGITRRQQEVETRLARLEATLSRQTRRTTRGISEHPFFALVIFLFLVNAFMILWIRFWQ